MFRFDMLYYPVNRNSDYGKPITVLAETEQEAINKAAVVIGDTRGDYQYLIKSINEESPRNMNIVQTLAEYGLL
jgi:hypothetical protein